MQDRASMFGAIHLTLGFYQNVTRGDDEPYLQFAWEDDRRRVEILERIEGFSPVDAVVVIGYSFPLFNRNLDRVVFEKLGPKEVFLQVAGDDAVKDRLVGLGVKSDIIRIVGDQNQFHIPCSYSPADWKSWRGKRV